MEQAVLDETVEPKMEPVSAAKSRRHENVFDFLRLVAAATVICGHSFTHFQIPFLGRMVDGKFEPGMYWFMDGVPLFFILSGLLVFQSCERCFEQGRPISSFYWNRFLRVGPAMYVYSLVIPFWLLGIGVMQFRDVLTREFAGWELRNLFFIPVGSPSFLKDFGIGVVNGSLWTIPVEVSFYIVLPLLLVIWRRFGKRAGLSVLIVAAMAGLVLRWALFMKYGHTTPVKFVDITLLPYLVWFAFGIIYGHVWSKLPQRQLYFWLAIVTYFGIRWIGFDHRDTAGPLYAVAFGIPLGYAVLWFGTNAPSWLNRLTAWGDVSYGIYIWHMIVVNTLLTFGFGASLQGLQRLWIVPVVLMLSYGVGLTSWRLIERHALRLKPYSSRTS